MAEQCPRFSIIIASPHALEAEGISAILADAGYQVICVPTEQSLFETLTEKKPDVILLDGCFCGEDMHTVRDLVQQQHAVAVLTDPEREGSFTHQALLAGARGCLSCDEEVVRFTEALKLISQGVVAISNKTARLMTQATRPGIESAEPEPLSVREQQISVMVAQGATNKEIGDEFFISEHTVKIHLGHILRRLKLRNRQQLAAYMVEKGLVHDRRD